MKKILSIVLVLCMLCTSCIMLSSCGKGGKLKEEDLKDNSEKQFEVLVDGADKAITDFFDVAGVNSVLGNMNKGSVQVLVENDVLSDYYNIDKIDETLYFDFSDNKLNALVSDTKVDYDDETLSGIIYFDGNAICVASNDLFGSSDSYKVTIADLAENFGDSDLADLIGDKSTVKEAEKALEMIEEAWKVLYPSTAEGTIYNKVLTYGQGLLKYFNPTVGSEKLDGTEVVTITYTINNQTIENFLYGYINDFPTEDLQEFLDMISEYTGADVADLDDLLDDAEDELDDVIDEMNDNIKFDVTLTFSIAKESSALVSAEIQGTIEPETKGVEGAINVEAKLKTSANEISLTASVVGEIENDNGNDTEMDCTVSMKLTKEEDDDKITIKGDVDVAYEIDTGRKNEMELDDLITLNVTYKKNGDLKIKVKIDNGSSYYGASELSMKGNLVAADGKVTFELDSLAVPGSEISDLGVTVIFDPNATIPAIPSDAKEFLTLEEDDLKDLVEEIQDSKLAGMFIGNGKEEGEISIPLTGEYRSMNGSYYIFYESGSYEYWDGDIREYSEGSYTFNGSYLRLVDEDNMVSGYGMENGYAIYTEDETYYFVAEEIFDTTEPYVETWDY